MSDAADVKPNVKPAAESITVTVRDQVFYKD